MPKRQATTATHMSPVIDWGNMRGQEKALYVEFFGAGRKHGAFHGWCGEVIEWPVKSAPKIRFGEWRKDVNTDRGAGIATCTVRPYALIMFGANSSEMRSKDKTTHFGFAGLNEDGTLRVVVLPKNMDARALFGVGGWPTQNIDTFVAQASQLGAMTSLKDLVALLDVVKAAFQDYGLMFNYIYGDPGSGNHISTMEDLMKRLPVIQASWPYLSPFCELVVTKMTEWQEARQQKRARFAPGKEEMEIAA